MRGSVIKVGPVFEDGGASVLARVYGPDGAAITQAAISTITCRVTAKSSGASVATPTVTVADSVFDTLQDDALWEDVDDVGYNFKHDLPATAFPTGGETYIVEYKFTPVSGAVFWVAVETRATGVYTS